MAPPATPEASEIRRRGRQRLIGAVTLVALLVVFVPMLLDSEPSRPRNTVPPIPSKDTAAPLPAPAPRSASVAPKPQAAAVVPEPAKVEPAKAQPAAVSAAPAATKTAPPAASKTAASAADAPRLVGFAVQVGAFRDEAKLRQARDKLTSAGVVHYTERLETKSGPLTRLRAGPYASREAAEGALVTIKRGALDGKVVSLP